MGTKMMHSGSLGMVHTIIVSDDLIHAKTIDSLRSTALDKLKSACKKYYKALMNADEKGLVNLSLKDAREEVEPAIKKWYNEQSDKVSAYFLAADHKGLEDMIKKIDNGTIAPGKDIRMVALDDQYYASNKKYSQNKTMSNSSRHPRIIR